MRKFAASFLVWALVLCLNSTVQPQNEIEGPAEVTGNLQVNGRLNVGRNGNPTVLNVRGPIRSTETLSHGSFRPLDGSFAPCYQVGKLENFCPNTHQLLIELDPCRRQSGHEAIALSMIYVATITWSHLNASVIADTCNPMFIDPANTARTYLPPLRTFNTAKDFDTLLTADYDIHLTTSVRRTSKCHMAVGFHRSQDPDAFYTPFHPTSFPFGIDGTLFYTIWGVNILSVSKTFTWDRIGPFDFLCDYPKELLLAIVLCIQNLLNGEDCDEVALRSMVMDKRDMVMRGAKKSKKGKEKTKNKNKQQRKKRKKNKTDKKADRAEKVESNDTHDTSSIDHNLAQLSKQEILQILSGQQYMDVINKFNLINIIKSL